MVYKIFLDANVVLDVLHADCEFHEEAKKLFLAVNDNQCKAYYSESILTIIAYVLRKVMSASQINTIILQLNKNIRLLSCTGIQPTFAAQKNPPDFEDALLYEIALHHQMDFFITSNVKDFKKFQQPNLPVIRARELNKMLEQ